MPRQGRLVLVLTVAALLANSTHAQSTAPLADSAPLRDKSQGILAATVAIETVGREAGVIFLGSGFLIAPTLVVTNHHVVANATRLAARTGGAGGTMLEVRRVLCSNVDSDLALLEVQRTSVAPLTLARVDDARITKVGASVLAAGYPDARAGTVSRHTVASVSSTGERRFEIAAGLAQGSSGGPLLDSAGRVVGIACVVEDGSQTRSYGIPVEHLIALLVRTRALEFTDRNRDPFGIGAILSTAGQDSIGDPVAPPMKPGDTAGTHSGIGTGSGSPTGKPMGAGSGPGSGSQFTPIAVKARILNSPRPDYTEIARLNGTEGNVVVKAHLGADGKVKAVNVVRGLPDGLDDRAVEAVNQLSFTPAQDSAGNAIDCWITVSVNFTIRGGPEENLGGPDVAFKAHVLAIPQPQYSDKALQDHIEGTVVLKVLLGSDGRVTTASVVSGLPDGLDEKAVEVATHVEFEPARDGAGKRVDSWIRLNVRFKLPVKQPD